MAASTTLLLTVLVSAVAVDASCFADYPHQQWGLVERVDRLYKTKYEVCNGGSEFFEVMNVSMSAPYFRDVGRHVLWRNHRVQVCLSGRANKQMENVNFLQNAAFGHVHFPLFPINSPFCDIDKNTCANMQPACQPDAALTPGQKFCTCSTFEVPGAALPGLDVDLTWIVMSTGEEPAETDCEVQRGTNQLAAKGKKKLICIKIPTVIRNNPNNGK